jgi:hypothetical protein
MAKVLITLVRGVEVDVLPINTVKGSTPMAAAGGFWVG